MSEAVRGGYRDNPGYEILDGRIVNMSPAGTGHNRMIGRLYRRLSDYLTGKRCEAFVDGLMVHLSEKDKVVPDVMVVCNLEIIGEAGVYGAPDLVVEVLSPSTAFNDRGYKKSLYERSGVREYWIVDIKGRAVEVYRLADAGYELDQAVVQHTPSDLELLTEEERRRLPKAVRSCIFPDLSIDLEGIFENI